MIHNLETGDRSRDLCPSLAAAANARRSSITNKKNARLEPGKFSNAFAGILKLLNYQNWAQP